MHVAVAAGIHDASLAAGAAAAGIGLVEVVDGDLERTVARGDVVAVVAGADGGIPIAQRVHHVDRGVDVILVAPDDAGRDALAATLAVTPGIPARTRCVAARSATAVDDLTELLAAAAQRAAHRRTVAEVRDGASLVAGAPGDAAGRYLGRLFDHVPVGILVVGGDGGVLAANPRAATILDIPTRGAVGATLASLLGADGGVTGLLEGALAAGVAATTTLRRPSPAGVQHLEVTVTAVTPGAPADGAIVLVHDETARIRTLEELDRARAEAEAAAERHAELARTLQESLLPPELPTIPGFSVAARYHAAGDGTIVGGDFYDAFRLADGRWCVVLGDVVGKGVAAATVTSLARYSLRTAALSATSVEALLATLNAVLFGYLRGSRFCTLAAIALGSTGDVEVAVAGHPPPVVVRRSGALEHLEPPVSPPLGLFEGIPFRPLGFRLGAGDAVVMTTDGVTEARSPDGTFVTDVLDRALPPVAGRDADELADAVDRELLAVERSRTRDDVAIVAVAAVDPPA